MRFMGWSYGQLQELPADYEQIIWAMIQKAIKPTNK